MADLPDDALRAAYEAHGGELFRFARRSLGDTGAAEDAVQEAFVRAWRASASYDPAKASQRTWLFAILRNVVVDVVRARRVRPPLSARGDEAAGSDDDAGVGTGSGDDAIDQMLTVWQVEAALAALAEDHRTALVEVHWRGRPYADVADELGVPEGTVKSRVYYGLRAMRTALESQGWRDG